MRRGMVFTSYVVLGLCGLASFAQQDRATADWYSRRDRDTDRAAEIKREHDKEIYELFKKANTPPKHLSETSGESQFKRPSDKALMLIGEIEKSDSQLAPPKGWHQDLSYKIAFNRKYLPDDSHVDAVIYIAGKIANLGDDRTLIKRWLEQYKEYGFVVTDKILNCNQSTLPEVEFLGCAAERRRNNGSSIPTLYWCFTNGYSLGFVQLSAIDKPTLERLRSEAQEFANSWYCQRSQTFTQQKEFALKFLETGRVFAYLKNGQVYASY